MHRLLLPLTILGLVCGVSASGAAGARGAGPAGSRETGAPTLAAGAAASVPAPGNAPAAQAAKMLLKLGVLKTEPEFSRLTGALESASRQALGELPGVRLLDATEDATAAVAKRRPPVVLITGKLVELGQRPEGEEVLISAKVEYFVHRMPGESIAAIVSGVATARVAPIQMRKRRLRERLERSIVAAAVESAARRTPPALKAAVK